MRNHALSPRASPVAGSRVWSTSFASPLLSPIVLVLFFEGALRRVDCGGDTSLFVPTSGEHEGFYSINPDVGRRYFSVPTPRENLFLQHKPADTYRILALGGSTIAGFTCGDNLSFTRTLYHRLLDAFPTRRIEMVNTGMSATSTHTLLDFMDEILEHEPDALLIYTGHNEFYGALGVASVESLGRFCWAIKLFLKLQHFRTFQLLRDCVLTVTAATTIASTSDPPADEVFSEARAHEKAERIDEARRPYYRAKNLDPLRFRAPEDFYTAIHEVAGQFGAPVVPIKARCEQACTDGIIEDERMLEHLHPNIDCYFLMVVSGIADLLAHKIGDAITLASWIDLTIDHDPDRLG